MRSNVRREFNRGFGAILALAGMISGGCVGGDEVVSSDVQSDWRKVETVSTPDGKLDVTTDRVLSYRVTSTADGESKVKEFKLHLNDGKAEVPLRVFYGPKVPEGAVSNFNMTPRGYVSSPDGGAVPGVLLMFDALPDGAADVGSSWTRHRPTDEEAADMDSAVRQSIRNYEVVEAWETPQGTVVRIRVDGYVRWFQNEYIQKDEVANFDWSPQLVPEHAGYVDVNLDTGTLVDGMFHIDIASKKVLASELDDPKTRVLRLCPGEDAGFVPSADTCATRKGGA